MISESTQGHYKRVTISSLPEEVLELVASQLSLSFGDVIAFSSTSRRIQAATKFLVARPLRVEDSLGTNLLEEQLLNPTLGLVRSMIIDVNFTSVKAQAQSEQLRLLLTHAPRLRYLSLHRPPPDPADYVPLWEPSRSKTAAHPFPLRSSHFQSSVAYLNNITHLDLGGLCVHSFLLTRFPQLTHLKLSLAEQRDAYLPAETLTMIAAARGCDLVAFEISLHTGASQRERLDVVRACVAAWPNLSTLHLFSVNREGRVPNIAAHWPRPEALTHSVVELSQELSKAKHFKNLALGIVLSADETTTPKSSDTPPNSSAQHTTKSVSESPGLLDPSSKLLKSSMPSLAALVRTACPALSSFQCLSLPAVRSGKRPFTEFYDAVCISWCQKRSGWTNARKVERDDEIFGMVGGAR